MVRELLHTYWSKLASLIFRLSFPSTKSLFKNVHKLIRKTQFIKKKHENTKLVLFRVFLRCLPLLHTLNICLPSKLHLHHTYFEQTRAIRNSWYKNNIF